MRDESTTRRKRPADRRFRFDPVLKEDQPAGSPDRGLVDLFREWISAVPRERRQSARHEAAGFQVWIGWWRGGHEFFALSAELINISRGGALIQLTASPPERQDIWICLDALDSDDCVGAAAIDVKPVRRGWWSARLEFRAPCPHSFFDAAVCGLGQSASREPGSGPGRSTRTPREPA